MNFKAFPSLLLISLTTVYPTISYSYNDDSHKRLSEEIAINSSLKSRFLPWGLKSMEDKLTLHSNDDRFADMTQSVMEWLLYGTEQEDAILSSNPARSHTSINLIFHEDLNQNVHPTRMKRQNLKLSFPVNILIQTFFYLSLRRIS